MSIPNLNFYSLQNTFYCKKLKSGRHDTVKPEKEIPVYAVSKGRRPLFEDRQHFFGNTRRRNAFGLNTVNDAAESLCIAAVKLCRPAEAVERRCRSVQHTCPYRSRTYHRNIYAEELKLHTQ